MLKSPQVPQIQNVPVQHFTLWGGEVCATVFRHIGAHGYPDAVIVKRVPDGPMEMSQFNAGYKLDFPREGDFNTRMHQREQAMDAWIVAELQKMSTGKKFDLTKHEMVDSGEFSKIVPGDKTFLFA